jgi:hypothetical protein
MLYQTIIIRQLKIIVLFLVATVFGAPSVEAGWLIDHEKFHASVHGQNSCHDCHADINDRTRHPDPTNVNKQSSDFFNGTVWPVMITFWRISIREYTVPRKL